MFCERKLFVQCTLETQILYSNNFKVLFKDLSESPSFTK